MAAAEPDRRAAIARRAAVLTGVEPTAILAEIAPDGLSHHATSAQVGAAIDQAIAELHRTPGAEAPQAKLSSRKPCNVAQLWWSACAS